MNTSWRTLWTVGIEHAFHGGPCDALGFVVPPATQQALTAMRAIAREHQGQLHVLVEEDGDGHPLDDASGQRLVFGLQPRSSDFARYTGELGLAEASRPCTTTRSISTALAHRRAACASSASACAHAGQRGPGP